jgi:hypothetical protein
MKSILTKNQKLKFSKDIRYGDNEARITATVRYDDDCGNGHNSFSITGDIKEKIRGRWVDSCGGCIHDEIAKHFPELKPFIKWHLVSSDEPMYYLQNTLYHVSDKDCWGHRKGEPCRFEDRLYFEGFPIQMTVKGSFLNWLQSLENFDLGIMAVHHKPGDYDFKPKYTFVGYEMDTWHKAPFDTEREASEFLTALNSHIMRVESIATDIGEGKEPDLEAARNSAIWPDAELSDFTKDRLQARLPALMAEFQRDVVSLGLVY